MSGPERPAADRDLGAPGSGAARRTESLWPGRVLAGAAGAGIVLAAIALRDALPLRRRQAPPPPREGWRSALARRLRGDDG